MAVAEDEKWWAVAARQVDWHVAPSVVKYATATGSRGQGRLQTDLPTCQIKERLSSVWVNGSMLTTAAKIKKN